MYIKKSFIILLVFIAFVSCKRKDQQTDMQAEAIEMDSEVVELDKEFIDFYNTFHTDTVFQLAHISFPLKQNPFGQDDAEWTAENWVVHRPFSDMDNSFRRDFQPMGGTLVIEKIIDASGYFEMERRFAKLVDGWNLIYYSVRNPREGKE